MCMDADSKKLLTNGLNMDLAHEPESKRQFVEWKHTDYPVKKKGQGAAVSKDFLIDILLGHKITHHFLFP